MWQHPQCVLLSPTEVSVTQIIHNSCSFVFIACFPSTLLLFSATPHVPSNILDQWLNYFGFSNSQSHNDQFFAEALI